MSKRIVTGVILLVLLLPMLLLSATPVLPAVSTVLCVIGIWELGGCCGWQKRLVMLIPAMAVGVGIQWATRIANDAIEVIACLSLSLLAFELFCAVFSKRSFDTASALSLAGLSLYISFGFASLVLLRDCEGVTVLPLAFLLPWGCDTMAYFGGCLFGKHKLIPEVSPKKTVEGAVCGTIGAALIALLYGWVVSLLTELQPSYLLLAISGVLVSILAQCGDLIMSLVEREHGIKDYGRLFPGHGGVLDRFDSVLISAPALYFIGYFASEWLFFA